MLSIYFSLLWAGLRSELEYRANFLVMIVMGLVYQLAGFIFIWVVLSRFQSLSGWGLGEVAFLYGLRLLTHSVFGIIFSHLWDTDWIVQQGKFDNYLLRPYPPLLQLITSSFPLSMLGDLLGGLALFFVANFLVGIDWSLGAFAYLVLAILGGSFIEAAFKLVVVSFSFRFLSTVAFLSLIDDFLNNFGNYPLQIFGGNTRFAFTFVLPIAFIAYFPATVLLGRVGELAVPTVFAYLSPFVGLGLFVIAYLFWQHEIRHYQSAGH